MHKFIIFLILICELLYTHIGICQQSTNTFFLPVGLLPETYELEVPTSILKNDKWVPAFSYDEYISICVETARASNIDNLTNNLRNFNKYIDRLRKNNAPPEQIRINMRKYYILRDIYTLQDYKKIVKFAKDTQ